MKPVGQMPLEAMFRHENEVYTITGVDADGEKLNRVLIRKVGWIAEDGSFKLLRLRGAETPVEPDVMGEELKWVKADWIVTVTNAAIDLEDAFLNNEGDKLREQIRKLRRLTTE